MRNTFLLKWKHRSTKPTIISRATWGARRFRRPPSPFTMRQLKGIAIHHQGGGYNLPVSEKRERELLKSIEGHQVVTRGWNAIAYNFVIFPSGRIYEGRGLYRSAANGNGALNRGYMAVCFAGNFVAGQPSQASLEAATRLVDWLQATHPRACKVTSHGGLHSTACPGPALTTFSKELDVNDFCQGGHS